MLPHTTTAAGGVHFISESHTFLALDSGWCNADIKKITASLFTCNPLNRHLGRPDCFQRWAGEGLGSMLPLREHHFTAALRPSDPATPCNVSPFSPPYPYLHPPSFLTSGNSVFLDALHRHLGFLQRSLKSLAVFLLQVIF